MTPDAAGRITGLADPSVTPSGYHFATSHTGLLGSAGEADRATFGGGCDAVLVPSHHRPFRLGYAADLAAGLGCPLLIVCTEGTQDDLRRRLLRRRPPVELWLLAVRHPARLPGLELRCLDEPGACPGKSRDSAAKRNLGLGIARMMGWRNLLLLDDDVRGLTTRDVDGAAGLLSSTGRWQAAGWRATDFPDNSVVCHAGRRAGVRQDVFVGAGALLVRVGATVPFFPPVYNQDWLFLFRLLAQGAVIGAGDVRQLPFNPFDPRPHRAHDEEFGDILGEGLFHLLHQRTAVTAATDPEFWRAVIEERRRTVRQIRHALTVRLDHHVEPTRWQRTLTRQAVDCLDVAARVHLPDLPVTLASFVRAWQHDSASWAAWIHGLPGVGAVADTLGPLGLAADRLTRATSLPER